MERVNRILHDPEFLDGVEKIRKAESSRVYCRHGPSHFLAVARVACILNLEERLGMEKELLYAAALLHDIGRWMEYAYGADHAAAGGELAACILRRCGFSDAERGVLLAAIAEHRNPGAASPLGALLFRADKRARNCVLCDARGTCKHFQNGETPILLD